MPVKVRLTKYLASLGYTQEDIDWMVEHEGFHLDQGGWNECTRESVMDHMLNRNPMFDPEVVQKAIETKKRIYGTANLRGDITETEKRNISRRMKENNPMRLFPEKNRTAQPINVEWSDGRVEKFSYAKELSKKYGIPYGTIKCWLKNSPAKSKKHGIARLTKV